MSILFRTAAYGWVMAGSMALLPASAVHAADSQALSGVKAQHTQAALQQQIDQADNQTQSALAQLRRLESETRTLRQQNAQRTRQLAGEATRQRKLALALDTLVQTRKALPRIEQDMVRQLEGFIQQDMPFLERERLARVQASDDTPGSAAHIRQLLKAWRTELDYGREVDSWRGRLTQDDGARRDVDFLRLGRIGWYYLTPDGREGGVWQADSRKWQLLDEAQRREVRHGLQVAKDQRAPGLLTVPLSIKVAAADSLRSAPGGGQ